jgi:hypothetical protein
VSGLFLELFQQLFFSFVEFLLSVLVDDLLHGVDLFVVVIRSLDFYDLNFGGTDLSS